MSSAEPLERHHRPGGAMSLWSPDRRLRSKRRSLNPTKAVFVYVAALCLVCFHQAGQVADWLDELALGSGRFVSETAFKLSAGLRSSVVPLGPAQMNRAEDRLLAMAPAGIMGQKPEALPARPGYSYQVARKLEPLPPAGLIVEDPGPAGPGAAFPPTFTYQTGYRPGPPPWAAEEEPGVFNPASVLLLGDSMMLEGLGPQLQRELKKNEGLEVFRDGRYGTGLTRLDAFDWLEYFDQILIKYDPDLVIITLGANDAQDILDPEGPKKRIRVSSDEWNSIYADRVKALLRQAAVRDTQIFWVGLPIIGREQIGKWFANINSIAAEVCSAASNCRFWDSWLSVADGRGQYTTFISDEAGKSVRIRAKDAIHLTEAGGRLMARKFLAETADWADYHQSSPPPNGPIPAPFGNAAPSAPAAGTPEPPAQAAPAPSAGETHEDGSAFTPPAGLVSEHHLYSKIRGRETVYFMAAPTGPGPFPAVFLLHGAWDGAGAWTGHLGREKLARLAAEHELILVMPDGEPLGWYLDGRETAIESYLIKELIPAVLSGNPAIDAQRLGVTGLSMGGHGALTLAWKHPRLFRAAGSLSGVTDLAAHSGRSHRLNPALSIDKVLGPAGPDGRLWRKYSAHGLAESDPAAWAGRPLIISVGRDDRLTLEENRAFHDLLTRLNIAHVYREDSGGHDWDYWSAQLPAHLEFIGGQLRDQPKRRTGQ